MDHLRIGIIAPPWFPVPPPAYGGTERVVSYLADGLAARGHEVTLFASGGSHTCAKLSSTFDLAPTGSIGDPIVEGRHVADAYRHAGEFDVIHDHTMLGLLAAAASARPVLHTIHGCVSDAANAFYASLGGRVELVCISDNQRTTLAPGLKARVIHNAVPTRAFPFRAEHGEYLLFVGRMCADKGILDAIEIARRTGYPLRILAKVNEPAEHLYFQEEVVPALAGLNAELLEQPPEKVRLESFCNARATLFPIHWEEPFGMVMIESMATGTPVIAFERGSVPEVVVDGETGFVVRTIEEAVDAVAKIPSLDRRLCREHVQRKFDAAGATEQYEQALYSLIGERGGTTLSSHASTLIPTTIFNKPVKAEEPHSISRAALVQNK